MSENKNCYTENKLPINEKLANANVVVGTPITTISGKQIIPITAMTFTNLSGSGEYGDLKTFKALDGFKLAGGSGSIFTVKPKAFLIDDGQTCKLVRIDDTPINTLIEKTEEMVSSLSNEK